MELVGIVRCPVHHLCMYGERRQKNPRDVNRIAKRFLRVKCKPNDEKNHLRGIITHDELRTILTILQKSKNQLAATTHNAQYPVLANFRIACLDGRHRLAAVSKNRTGRLWAVKLFCVAGEWIDFPVKLLSDTVSDRVLQDEVEAYSHESNYSDGEIYRLVRKYMRAKDESRETECRTRLSSCREISLNGLLKHKDIRDSLDDLLQFPGIVGGLQLSNFHKHIALHCNEQIQHYFVERINRTWTFITDNNSVLKSQVDTQTVELLQLRMPVYSKIDRRVISSMIDSGEVFEGIKDSGIRQQLKLRILSLDILIPSVETFHENMKFFSIGAKILLKHVLDDPPKGRAQATLFQRLSASWTSPAVSYIETSDSYLTRLLEPELTPYIAYKMIMLAAWRNFPTLSDDSPRQDVRGETMPSRDTHFRIRYLQMLAYSVGFKTKKATFGISQSTNLHDASTFIPHTGPPAQWRAGKPFTKTLLSLHANAYLVNLSNKRKFTEENYPAPLLVMRDFMNAFFDNSETYVIDDRRSGTRLENVVGWQPHMTNISNPNHEPNAEGLGGNARPEPSNLDECLGQGTRARVQEAPQPTSSFGALSTTAREKEFYPPPHEQPCPSQDGSRHQHDSTLLRHTIRSFPNSDASLPQFQVKSNALAKEKDPGPTNADTLTRASSCSMRQDPNLDLDSTIEEPKSDMSATPEDTLRRSSVRSPLGIASKASPTHSRDTPSSYSISDLVSDWLGSGSHVTTRRENMVINGQLWHTPAGNPDEETTEQDLTRNAWPDQQAVTQATTTSSTLSKQTELAGYPHPNTQRAPATAISEATITRRSMRSPPQSIYRSDHSLDSVVSLRKMMARPNQSIWTPEQATMPNRMGRLSPWRDNRFSFECPPDIVAGLTPASESWEDQVRNSTISRGVSIRPIRSMRKSPQSVRIPPIRSMRVRKRTEHHLRSDVHAGWQDSHSEARKQARFENGEKHDGTTESPMVAERLERSGVLGKKRARIAGGVTIAHDV